MVEGGGMGVIAMGGGAGGGGLRNLSGYPTKVLPLIQKPQITSLRGLQINVVLKFQFSNLVC